MLINRTCAQIAAAGHGDPCLPHFSQQGAEEVVRSPHIFRQIVLDTRGVNPSGIDAEGGFIEHSDLCSHGKQDLYGNINIADIGNVLYNTRFVGKNDSREYGNCGVFRTADGNFALKFVAAPDNILFQSDTPFSFLTFLVYHKRFKNKRVSHFLFSKNIPLEAFKKPAGNAGFPCVPDRKFRETPDSRILKKKFP